FHPARVRQWPRRERQYRDARKIKCTAETLFSNVDRPLASIPARCHRHPALRLPVPAQQTAPPPISRGPFLQTEEQRWTPPADATRAIVFPADETIGRRDGPPAA